MTIEEQDRQFLRFLFRMGLGICIGYAILWFAILRHWEPGDQEAIYRDYRPQRHEAISLTPITVPSPGEIVTR
jgi:hypothetical protein